jgi:hypothetical protein
MHMITLGAGHYPSSGTGLTDPDNSLFAKLLEERCAVVHLRYLILKDYH